VLERFLLPQAVREVDESRPFIGTGTLISPGGQDHALAVVEAGREEGHAVDLVDDEVHEFIRLILEDLGSLWFYFLEFSQKSVGVLRNSAQVFIFAERDGGEIESLYKIDDLG
jgi:hypothetical protein